MYKAAAGSIKDGRSGACISNCPHVASRYKHRLRIAADCCSPSRTAGRTNGRTGGRSLGRRRRWSRDPTADPRQVVATPGEENVFHIRFLSVRLSFSVFSRQTDCHRLRLRLFLRASARRMRRTPVNRERRPLLPPLPSSSLSAYCRSDTAMLSTKSDFRVVFILLAAQMTSVVFAEFHGTYSIA